MKVLLDEDLDHRLRKSLSVHEVFTVRYLGWAGLKNGELLLAAEQSGIDVFVITLSATNWPIIRNHLTKIAAAIDRAVPGSFQAVECGSFSRKRQQEPFE